MQVTKEWLFFLSSLTHFSPCCIAVTFEKIRKPLGFLFSRGLGMQQWGEMGSTILDQWRIVGYPEIVENLQVFLHFQSVQIWVKYGTIWVKTVNIIDFHVITYKMCCKQYEQSKTKLSVQFLKKVKLHLNIHLSSIVTCHVNNHVFV